jgi:uncharacterized protein (TIGR03083 family)
MEANTLISQLDHEYALLTAALTAADPAAVVPSCPDWSVADLENHVTAVYLHKAECMRLGAFPDPWPPADGVGTLADAYAALQGEFASRGPEDRASTWFDPDQTVGFWIRRMAHETAIHRIDAELAAGHAITPIDADLAVDGIDELLKVFVAFASESWPEDFAEVLPGADGRDVLVAAGGRAWTVTAKLERIAIADADANTAAGATVTGEPGTVYRWLWRRGGDVTIVGDNGLATQLRSIMEPAMQ